MWMRGDREVAARALRSTSGLTCAQAHFSPPRPLRCALPRELQKLWFTFFLRVMGSGCAPARRLDLPVFWPQSRSPARVLAPTAPQPRLAVLTIKMTHQASMACS